MPIHPKHWNYFLAVEAELSLCSRYVDFSDKNYACYSNEFAKIIVLAGSEVDSIFFEICRYINPSSGSRNIRQFYCTLVDLFPRIAQCEVVIARDKIELQPFCGLSGSKSPDWWAKGYNKIKHERSAHFSNASLLFALQAVGAQFLALQLYHNLVHKEWVSVEYSFRSALYGPKELAATRSGIFSSYGDPFHYLDSDGSDDFN